MWLFFSLMKCDGSYILCDVVVLQFSVTRVVPWNSAMWLFFSLIKCDCCTSVLCDVVVLQVEGCGCSSVYLKLLFSSFV